MIKNCPYCGDDIPAVLYDAHVEACESNPGTSSTGALLEREGEREQESELPDNSAPLPSRDDLAETDDLFGDLTFSDPDPEVDDEFAKLVGQLDVTPAIVDVNVTTLDDLELNRRFTTVNQSLLERAEMINPTTQTGRDLHSERAAYLIELRKRGLAD